MKFSYDVIKNSDWNNFKKCYVIVIKDDRNEFQRIGVSWGLKSIIKDMKSFGWKIIRINKI